MSGCTTGRVTTVSTDIEQRGKGIPKEQRELVELLRAQAFEVQQRFDLAEHSALLLDRALGEGDDAVGSALNDTYEAHAFVRLRIQLFRILLVDLWACVLDRDGRTASIRNLLRELRKDDKALDALRAYYSDPSALTVQVENADGSEVTAEDLEREKVRSIERSVKDTRISIDRHWEKIEAESTVLSGTQAKRIKWARHKVAAHFEKSATGVVAISDDPQDKDGTVLDGGKITWGEPIEFLRTVRPHVYDVICLITANNWSSSHAAISDFYAQAFWDRLRNGSTKLTPAAVGLPSPYGV